MKPVEKREAYRLECEKCAAELFVIVEFAPGFRDFSPVCPYCGKAMVEA